MPLFDFVCTKCDIEKIDVLVKQNGFPVVCDSCGSPMQKMIHPHSFRLTGTGWYETDFKNKSS